MAPLPDVIDACLTMAGSIAKTVLENSVDEAISALKLAETQTTSEPNRDLIHTAGQGLAEFKQAWANRFAVHLLAEFRESQQTPFVTTPVSAARGRPVLSLVDDEEMSRSVESARLLQQMLPHVEQSLA
ncbi:MAG: hypothetical protein H7224_04460, partial [Polaromonas sp.]|nr:hypothetical protein [Polaromonas sp.]